MENFIKLMPLCSGFYLILIGLIIETQNFRSFLLFRFTPLLIGLGCLFSAGKLFNWI